MVFGISLNFIIFLGGFSLNFSPHLTKNIYISHSGHRGHYDHIWPQKKESYKKNAVIQAIVAIVTTIGHTSNTISNEILKFFFGFLRFYEFFFGFLGYFILFLGF